MTAFIRVEGFLQILAVDTYWCVCVLDFTVQYCTYIMIYYDHIFIYLHLFHEFRTINLYIYIYIYIQLRVVQQHAIIAGDLHAKIAQLEATVLQRDSASHRCNCQNHSVFPPRQTTFMKWFEPFGHRWSNSCYKMPQGYSALGYLPIPVYFRDIMILAPSLDNPADCS